MGSGRPWSVPMSLDYFQGFLVQAGVADQALPRDGRILTPAQALELVPQLVATPVTLANFGPRRMVAQLLLEVAEGGAPVTREVLHARMRRFSDLLVVRPDGYLVRPTTGEALQWAGTATLTEGSLRAGSFEVGPFYRRVGGLLYPVGEDLQVQHGARPVGPYAPDDGVVSPMAEGAFLAVVDAVEGLVRLAFQSEETLKGLARLPGALHQLYDRAPQLREAFRAKPYAEQVRTIARLTTATLLILGSAGGGATKAASWGSHISAAIPLLSLSEEGLLELQLVTVPIGAGVATSAAGVGATYVLHMASTGAQGAGGGWPPVGGPGQWVVDASDMSEQARAYQAQVTGAPRGWDYEVCHGGDCVTFDGYDAKTGTLFEAKARGYDKFFDSNLEPASWYRGLKKLVTQATDQDRIAGGLRVRWVVAEPRMVAILQKAFGEARLTRIEVVHIPPLQ